MLTNCDFASYLSDESQQDVEFVVQSVNILKSEPGRKRRRENEEASIHREEGVEEGRIKAHKLLLAFVSPVFKAQFFGPLAKSSSNSQGNNDEMERVVIQGHNFAAFKLMIEHIYSGRDNKAEVDIRATSDLQVLFDLYALSDKYFLDTLKIIVQGTIHRLPLCLQDYEVVMSVLLHYSELANFDALCSELKVKYYKCILHEQKANLSAFYHIWANPSATQLKLLGEMMKMMNNKIICCPKCDRPKNICMYGEVLTSSNCSEGLCVEAVNEMHYEKYIAEPKTRDRVTKFAPTHLEVMHDGRRFQYYQSHYYLVQCQDCWETTERNGR